MFRRLSPSPSSGVDETSVAIVWCIYILLSSSSSSSIWIFWSAELCVQEQKGMAIYYQSIFAEGLRKGTIDSTFGSRILPETSEYEAYIQTIQQEYLILQYYFILLDIKFLCRWLWKAPLGGGVVKPSNSEKVRRFGGTYRSRHQNRNVSHARNQQKEPSSSWFIVWLILWPWRWRRYFFWNALRL
jgi:hypothetical protein